MNAITYTCTCGASMKIECDSPPSIIADYTLSWREQHAHCAPRTLSLFVWRAPLGVALVVAQAGSVEEARRIVRAKWPKGLAMVEREDPENYADPIAFMHADGPTNDYG